MINLNFITNITQVNLKELKSNETTALTKAYYLS